jgi:hypothetical protein
VAAHLWTDPEKHPAPVEYVTLVLCRDVYHCTPSQLRQENAKDIMTHLAIMKIESKARGNDSKKKPAGKRSLK